MQGPRHTTRSVRPKHALSQHVGPSVRVGSTRKRVIAKEGIADVSDLPHIASAGDQYSSGMVARRHAWQAFFKIDCKRRPQMLSRTLSLAHSLSLSDFKETQTLGDFADSAHPLPAEQTLAPSRQKSQSRRLVFRRSAQLRSPIVHCRSIAEVVAELGQTCICLGGSGLLPRRALANAIRLCRMVAERLPS